MRTLFVVESQTLQNTFYYTVLFIIIFMVVPSLAQKTSWKKCKHFTLYLLRNSGFLWVDPAQDEWRVHLSLWVSWFQILWVGFRSDDRQLWQHMKRWDAYRSQSYFFHLKKSSNSRVREAALPTILDCLSNSPPRPFFIFYFTVLAFSKHFLYDSLPMSSEFNTPFGILAL